MLAYFGRQPFAGEQGVIDPYRRTRCKHFDSFSVAQRLQHCELLKSFTGTQLRPIQNLGAPDISRVQNFEPLLGGLLFQAPGNYLLELITPAETFG